MHLNRDQYRDQGLKRKEYKEETRMFISLMEVYE